MPKYFAQRVLQWHEDHPRSLPWDGMLRDAYHIWVSEIILQQTRMEQGGPYIRKFLKRFPDVNALAYASEDDVLKQWQGLGYYSRARNMHLTSKMIVDQYRGHFPDTYSELISLPGIGDYTAAAILSFAFGLPYPVVDGNVKRVISRFYGIHKAPDSSQFHEEIKSNCQLLIKGCDPAVFNQAIMNFGAVVCTPGQPDCADCPVHRKCFAYLHNCVSELPVRVQKKANTIRHFHFIVLQYRGKILLEKRQDRDIWHALFAPPVLELSSSRKPFLRQFSSFLEANKFSGDYEYRFSTTTVRQELSHQSLHMRFHVLALSSMSQKQSKPYVWVSKKNYLEYGVPKVVAEMLEDYYSVQSNKK